MAFDCNHFEAFCHETIILSKSELPRSSIDGFFRSCRGGRVQHTTLYPELSQITSYWRLVSLAVSFWTGGVMISLISRSEENYLTQTTGRRLISLCLFSVLSILLKAVLAVIRAPWPLLISTPVNAHLMDDFAHFCPGLKPNCSDKIWKIPPKIILRNNPFGTSKVFFPCRNFKSLKTLFRSYRSIG